MLPSFSSICDNSLINSGLEPQQPPKHLISYFLKSFIISANSFAVTLYSLVLGSGSPALGLTTIGSLVHFERVAITGSNSLGPNEQFTPSASTPSPLKVSAIDGIEQPVNVLWFISNVIVIIIGRLEFSLAARTAALHSSKSVIVSKTIRSASFPANIISLYMSYASSNLRTPVGSKSCPIGPISSATYASGLTFSQACLAFLTAAPTSSSTLCPLPSSL